MLRHILFNCKYWLISKYLHTDYSQFNPTNEMRIADLCTPNSLKDYDHVTGNAIFVSTYFNSMSTYIFYIHSLNRAMLKAQALDRSHYPTRVPDNIYMDDWIHTDNNSMHSLNNLHLLYQHEIKTLIKLIKSCDENNSMGSYYIRISSPIFQQSRNWNLSLTHYRELLWKKR